MLKNNTISISFLIYALIKHEIINLLIIFL